MLPLELSVNCTVKGALPELGLALKLAVGGRGALEPPRAFCKLSRPPLTHLPANVGNGSTFDTIRLIICW